MGLLDKIVNIEQEYSELTSIPEYKKNYIRYRDEITPEIPFQNYIYIEKSTNIDEMREIVTTEKEIFHKNKNPYLRFVFDPFIPQSGEIPELSEFSFESNSILVLNLEETKVDFAHNNCFPIKTEDKNLLLDLFNELNKNYKFLQPHIKRWVDLKIENEFLDTVVYSENHRFLGNCELFTKGNLAKLDDFEVIEEFRNKKIGDALLRSAISICKSKDVKILYLITDSNDWVYEYYLRKGFKVFAEYHSCTLYR